MLPRSQRLSTEQFNQVMKLGRAYHSPLFLVRVADTKGTTRVSAAVPVKVGKLAVIRNKFRRKIYEAVHPLMEKVIQDRFVVIIAKNTILTATQRAMETEIESVFVKAKLLR
ncbi:MAG: ribonuclease P protein component [Candidatus Taylorbacteria bacterium]